MAAYLRQRRLDYVYELEIPGARIDFTVSHPCGRIGIEVYEPMLKLPGRSGFFDSSPAIRHAFERTKKRQIAAAKKAALPLLIVLGRGNSDIPFQAPAVTSAMFGALGVTFPVGADGVGRSDEARMAFGSGGRLQPMMNRGVSAIGIVSAFNPTLWRPRQRIDGLLRERGDARSLGEYWRLSTETFDHFEATGDFVPEALVARLTVLHNPFAFLPIPPDVFGGPHDSQWAAIERDDGGAVYGPVCDGLRRWIVPT